jgi:F-box interacting protein
MIVSIISILKLIFLTSKSLKSLIDSHNFINLHLKNSLNFNLILHCDLLDFYLTDFPNLTTRIELSFPLKTFCYSGIIIGSCNGLLCIWNSASSGPREIAFWNPCIRKHLILPRPPLFKAIKGFRTDNHGFGFDPFTRDYKYVLIACFIYPKFRTFHSAVNLFSLESNSWKELPSIPYILCSREHAVGFLVPNSIHWVVNPKVVTVLHEWKYQPRLILAFNLTSEIFNEVPLPEIVNNGINSQVVLRLMLRVW